MKRRRKQKREEEEEAEKGDDYRFVKRMKRRNAKNDLFVTCDKDETKEHEHSSINRLAHTQAPASVDVTESEINGAERQEKKHCRSSRAL
jgi:hypothetical protein